MRTIWSPKLLLMIDIHSMYFGEYLGILECSSHQKNLCKLMMISLVNLYPVGIYLLSFAPWNKHVYPP